MTKSRHPNSQSPRPLDSRTHGPRRHDTTRHDPRSGTRPGTDPGTPSAALLVMSRAARLVAVAAVATVALGASVAIAEDAPTLETAPVAARDAAGGTPAIVAESPETLASFDATPGVTTDRLVLPWRMLVCSVNFAEANQRCFWKCKEACEDKEGVKDVEYDDKGSCGTSGSCKCSCYQGSTQIDTGS